ncbi:HD family phosphohydrolase [Nonlabens ponticola]|uniref:HDIG domain-containing protein n=1 Tax=Nonlabens ponticola TaxID=2496866 RepID=A0A3S9MZS2_9FLAO|nr:HDIG domain-containing metalloprotein [Nonlabens ponticola]AZQ44634.1 HDIG domain-containing protein [Nonlabens ponticola]
MKLNNIKWYAQQDLIIKILLVMFSTAVTVYFFPKSDRFKYDYVEGEPWEYETLYAPYKFPILKSEQQLKEDRAEIIAQTPRHFYKEPFKYNTAFEGWQEAIRTSLPDSTYKKEVRPVIKNLERSLKQVYERGYLEDTQDLEGISPIVLKNEDNSTQLAYDDLIIPEELQEIIRQDLLSISNIALQDRLRKRLLLVLKPNVFFDQQLTDLNIQSELDKILPTQGLVAQNARIIAQGEIVEGRKLRILETLNSSYESQTWTESQYNWKLTGYLVLVGMAYTMLLLFVYKYRPAVYATNKKLAFIYFNLCLFAVLTSVVLKLNIDYIYIVPVCMLPLILKAFFDARLGLFSHVIIIFILSFVVPSSGEYLFLQMMAGIVTILSGKEIYKRANLFVTVSQIVGVYFVSYFAFYAIYQGGVSGWEWDRVLYFVLCGLAMLFVWPLIYVFEKMFNMVSDVSLLELSDTNSKLLKELSNNAPGTFHHSLNVANIAETAANEIGANAMLVRVGALYHDIGKMRNPTYFTENQGSGINPHDDLDPEESAEIIIDHVINGIEIAKKYKLPDRIIDFIRTHHGDNTVYYFLKKAQNINPDIDTADYQYPGPRPFSPETAILMISDSVEAASKSLKTPTSAAIDKLVDSIIDSQIAAGQFLNADITFKQIELLKAVIKKKLAGMYHLRIEYPE